MDKENKNIVKGKAIYTLDMYLNGIPFEEWFKRMKKTMLLNVLDMAQEKGFYVKFTVRELTSLEEFQERKSIQRADGKYCAKGEFVSLYEAEELVKQHCKVIELNGYIEESEQQ
jgi:hypothetical protein